MLDLFLLLWKWMSFLPSFLCLLFSVTVMCLDMFLDYVVWCISLWKSLSFCLFKCCFCLYEKIPYFPAFWSSMLPSRNFLLNSFPVYLTLQYAIKFIHWVFNFSYCIFSCRISISFFFLFLCWNHLLCLFIP